MYCYLNINWDSFYSIAYKIFYQFSNWLWTRLIFLYFQDSISHLIVIEKWNRQECERNILFHIRIVLMIIYVSWSFHSSLLFMLRCITTRYHISMPLHITFSAFYSFIHVIIMSSSNNPTITMYSYAVSSFRFVYLI